MDGTATTMKNIAAEMNQPEPPDNETERTRRCREECQVANNRPTRPRNDSLYGCGLHEFTVDEATGCGGVQNVLAGGRIGHQGHSLDAPDSRRRNWEDWGNLR